MRYTLIFGKLRSPGVAGTRKVFEEWAKSGLAQTSYWLDLEDPSVLLEISEGGEKEFQSRDWISANIGAGAEVNGYVIQPLIDAESQVEFDEADRALEKLGGIGSIATRLVNVIVPTEDQGSLTKDVAFGRNVNYIAEPVDSASQVNEVLVIGKRSKQYFHHAAKELMTVAGLWPGQTQPGIANESINNLDESAYIVGRSFVRYVDASSLVSAVAEQLLKKSDGQLPKTIDTEGSFLDVVGISEASDYVDRVVDGFFDAHKSKLEPKLPAARQIAAPEKANFFTPLINYFKWVWQNVKEMSRRVIKDEADTLKAKLASKVQDLYGYDSKVAVFVGGVTAHNDPAGKVLSVSELIEKEAERQFSKAKDMVKPEPENPGKLWRYFIEVATSLVDGGSLSEENKVYLPQYGANVRRVITDPRLIAPSRSDSAFPIPAHLDINMAGTNLENNDPLTVRLVLENVESIIARPGRYPNLDISALITLSDRLQKWNEQNNSFVWKVGQKLAGNIEKALNRWREIAGSLPVDNSEEELRAAKEKAYQSFRKFVFGGFAILGSASVLWLGQALVLFFVSGAWPVLSAVWWIPALIVGAVIAVWNIVSAFALKNELTEYHRVLNKQNEAKERIKYAEEVRGQIWSEIFRLSQLYKQYQEWSAVLSPFVYRNTNGGEKLESSQRALLVTTKLPASMAIARLTADSTSTQGLLKDVNSKFFGPGWMLSAVETSIVEAGFDYNQIWQDNRRSETSELARLAKKSGTPEMEAIIRKSSATIIENLASDGDAYQSWEISTEDAAGEVRSSNGVEFIKALCKGKEPLMLPPSKIFTSDAFQKGEIDLENSVLDVDSKITVTSDLKIRQGVQASKTESRKLDFMAVRMEISHRIDRKFLSIFSGVEKLNSDADFKPTETATIDLPNAES